jgi:guanylate kinase
MEVLRQRLTGRGTDSPETIELRLSKTREELTAMKDYDYVVVNGDLTEAMDCVKSIVTAEHSRVADNMEELLKGYREEI